MRGVSRRVTYGTLVGLFVCAWCAPARCGGLTLTSAGNAQGLSLTTFASNFPNSGGIGPIGIAFPTTGGVLVTNPNAGSVQLFPADTDGQNAATIAPINSFGLANAFGLGQLNGNIYMTQQVAGDVVQLINNGASTQVVVSGIPGASAVIGDPFNNLLYVDRSGNGAPIYVVDPIAKTTSLFVNIAADGLSLSADGKTLYAAIDGGTFGGHVLGFNTTTGNQVFDSGFIPGGPDGTAVGTGALFSNYIFANTNGGTVVEINVSTLVQTTIATGGSRGDFVSVDPFTNTLLLTQTDSIVRLSGASFTTTPEPSSLVLAGTAAVTGLGFWVRRRKRAAL
jgi:hypothetical protein